MPLYEYECKKCKKHTEKIQKFSDPEITECPHCGGTLERVVSAAAIAFKGGGWFKDGYASAKTTSSGEGESKSKNDSGASPAPAAEASGPSSKDATPAPASSAPATKVSPAATPPAASSTEKK